MKPKRMVLLLMLFTGIAVSLYKVKTRRAERLKMATAAKVMAAKVDGK